MYFTKKNDREIYFLIFFFFFFFYKDFNRKNDKVNDIRDFYVQ